MSSMSVSSPSVKLVRSRVRPKARKGQSTAVITSAIDKAFLATGAYPFMQHHLSLRQQTVQLSTISVVSAFLTTSTVTPTFAAAGFSISGTFGAGTALNTALTLFDQYRVDLVETWITPQSFSAGTNEGTLVSAVDLDDSNVPTAIATVGSYPSSIVSGGLSGHYHRWVPHAALDAYSGTFTSFANVRFPWTDSGSPGVIGYGLKVGATATSTPATVYNLLVRMTVSFRGTF